MLKIGLLGVGAIGRVIAMALDQGQIDAELVAVADQDRERAESLSKELFGHPPVVSIDEMIERCELAVEAASQAALPEFVPKALARGRDMLIMSVGGLLGREEWFRQAGEKNCRIYVPSGAIAGLDGIKAASIGRIEMAQLTSRKPIAALRGIEIRGGPRDRARRIQRRGGDFRWDSRRGRARVSGDFECGCVSASRR